MVTRHDGREAMMIVDTWRERFCQHHKRCGFAFGVMAFLIATIGLEAIGARNTLQWLLSVCVNHGVGT